MIIQRINPNGLMYQLSPFERNVTSITLINRGEPKTIRVNHPIEQLNQSWYNWQQNGDYIQDAFNYLSTDEREFLMTGITKEEWAAIFPPESEE